MNLFNLFKRRGTAPIARDRLQILLAYERGSTRGAPDLLAILREEILTAVGRHVEIELQSRERAHGSRRQGLDPRSRHRNSQHGADGAGRKPTQASGTGPSLRILIALHPDRAALAAARLRRRCHNSELFVKFFATVLSCP